jgi:glyoxylase-like metal-dependent hydrolase (beta-lactamase superfamily II)
MRGVVRRLGWLVWLSLGMATSVHARDIVFSKLTEGVYAHVADTGGRTYANDAINANLGLVVTANGAILIDSGASYLGAKKVAEAVRQVTQQPVKWVINSGNQDQRWLGNGYFKEQGAQVIAHLAGRAYMESSGRAMVNRLKPILKDKLQGTVPVLSCPAAGWKGLTTC